MLPLPDDKRFSELDGGRFSFACHPQVPCFNQCCRKLNLLLTPYDVLRLKDNLGVDAAEFLDQRAEVEHGQNGWPVPMLKMSDNDEQTCPFVSDEGCTVYPDRPGACRTYPLGRATKGGKAGGPSEEGFFVVKEDHCQGFSQEGDWSPETWMADQGLETYNYMNDLFMPLITRQAPDANPQVIAQKMRMFFMACYNLEAFGKFVAKSGLTDMFEIEQARLEVLAGNQMELLKFAFEWLRFSIFGERTLSVKPEVAEKMKARMPY